MEEAEVAIQEEEGLSDLSEVGSSAVSCSAPPRREYVNRVHLTEFTKELCVVFFPPPFNLSLLVPSHRRTSALFSHTVHPRDSKD